ncbi:uncharacterized protein LOC124461779 [Drosophila willistoni]|uniref:uncharacterized protein LOC124461779 n=1 Tax=Drosophila willistoni TaxID=7260 RepID=UPI001F0750BC|nr:uncharacterized protein LOC124461779 [Drosophila willistoni]
MDEVNINSFRTVQLKNWLAVLGLPTTGSKADLVARLNQVPLMGRGCAPAVTDDSGPESEEGQVNPMIQSCQNGDLDANNSINEDPDLQQQNLPDERGDAAATNFGNFNGMLNIIRKLEAEVKANSERLQAQARHDGAAEVGARSPDIADSDNRGAQINDEQQKGSFALAKEIAVDFDGQDCASKWIGQLKSIAQVFELNETCVRMLFVAKLKGAAKRWIQANPTRLIEPFEQLCEHLMLSFGQTSSKATLRRNFEQRMWQRQEKFATYFEAKMTLAENINLDTEELLEHLIEGISSDILRDQARIRCFTDPMELLKAFTNIQLPNVKSTADWVKPPIVKKSADGKEWRCYNCNARGHIAKDCGKPKRPLGSCYGCGVDGHFIAQCPKRKVRRGDDDDYNAS